MTLLRSAFPQVIDKSQQFLKTLEALRTTLQEPRLSADKCEEFARSLSVVPPIKARTKPVKGQPIKVGPKRAVPARMSGASKNGSAVAKGRQDVAAGLRPKLVDALIRVIGTKVLDASGVIAELTKRKWMPNAKKPQGYVSFTLSKEVAMFERASRGLYGLTPEGLRQFYRLTKTAPKPAAKPKGGLKREALVAAVQGLVKDGERTFESVHQELVRKGQYTSKNPQLLELTLTTAGMLEDKTVSLVPNPFEDEQS